MRHLPRVVSLPGDFKIRIRMVDKITLTDKVGKDCDAAWVKEEMAIFILEEGTNARKWYLLAHEMQHAVADWLDNLLLSGVAKV